MKLLHYSTRGSARRVGVLTVRNTIADLEAIHRDRDPHASPWPNTIDAIIAARLLPDVDFLVRDSGEAPEEVPLSDAKLHAPLLRPTKIIGVGMNYADHAREAEIDFPPEPVFFAKFTNSIIGPDEPILLPEVSSQVDWEAELGVVIGKSCQRVSIPNALESVAGYVVANDVTARDWQFHKPLRQWLLGKSFDTFLPLGPWFVTADEITDPARLNISCRLNGEVVQSSMTELHFSIGELIAYLSNVMTLEPGDLILTGTPGGVGVFRKPPRFLSSGDTLQTEIDNLGTLKNPVAARGTIK